MMADTISSDRRSKIMSHIKSKDTSIEMMVRRRLFAMGYRYRVNYKALPGKPDIVFTKKKIAIFIHGCYWHGHDCGSRYAHTSQSNKTYWGPKIERTKQRDQEHIQELKALGWKVVVLWECEIKQDFDNCMHLLVSFITDTTMRQYFTNLFGNYEDNVDPLNWVVHRPAEFQLDSSTLVELPRKGLLTLINFLLS